MKNPIHKTNGSELTERAISRHTLQTVKLVPQLNLLGADRLLHFIPPDHACPLPSMLKCSQGTRGRNTALAPFGGCPVSAALRERAARNDGRMILWSFLSSTHRSESRDLVDFLLIVDLGPGRAVHIANRPTAVSVIHLQIKGNALLAKRVPSGGSCRTDRRRLVADAEAEARRPSKADGAAGSRRWLRHYKDLLRRE